MSDAPTSGRPGEEPGPAAGPPPLTPSPAPPSVAQPPSAAPPPAVRPVAAPGGLSPVPPGPPPPRTAWGARLFVFVVGALAGIGGYFAATRLLPRWWASQISQVADQSFTKGITAGLVCGAVFTLLPLLVVRAALRRGASWSYRFVLLVLAVLVAVPNLITLFVVLGTNESVRIASDVFDRQAPGFRGATLAGAVIGGVLALALWWVRALLRRRRRQVAELKAALAEKEAAGVKGADESADKDD